METNTNNYFMKVLGDLRKGNTITELSAKLQALVKACRETGKKGKLQLSLTVSPTQDGESAAVADDVKLQEPVMNRASTLFYCTDENLLTRVDPRQEEMRFVVVENQEQPAAPAAKSA